LFDHTGIFALIAARAAAEDEAEGKTRITPYWRTLKGGGEVNPKFPGGVSELKDRLESERHAKIAKGKQYLVLVCEKSLWKRSGAANPSPNPTGRPSLRIARHHGCSVPRRHCDAFVC
jgi:hypothetical protein